MSKHKTKLNSPHLGANQIKVRILSQSIVNHLSNIKLKVEKILVRNLFMGDLSLWCPVCKNLPVFPPIRDFDIHP